MMYKCFFIQINIIPFYNLFVVLLKINILLKNCKKKLGFTQVVPVVWCSMV